MPNETPQDDDLKQLWQQQHTEGVRMSLEQIQSNATSFQRTIRRRNAREYAAALLVVLFFAWRFSHTSDMLMRVSFGLLIASAIYVAWQLHAKGSVQPLPKEAGLLSYLEFQRRELERQRNLLRSIWRWYLGPMIPGLAVLLVAVARTHPGHLNRPGPLVALNALVFAAAFFAIAQLNRRAARKLQHRIDELDREKNESSSERSQLD